MKTDKKIEYGEWEYGFSKLIEVLLSGQTLGISMKGI